MSDNDGDPRFRQACVDALHEVLHQHEPVHPDAVSLALDALLPVLSEWIKPHRWDKDYPDNAPPGPCRGSAPDTFYAGVLHAAAVVRDLLPPKPREDGGHDYVSTACQHDLHDRCRQVCKFCQVPCGCDCHHKASDA